MHVAGCDFVGTDAVVVARLRLSHVLQAAGPRLYTQQSATEINFRRSAGHISRESKQASQTSAQTHKISMPPSLAPIWLVLSRFSFFIHLLIPTQAAEKRHNWRRARAETVMHTRTTQHTHQPLLTTHAPQYTPRRSPTPQQHKSESNRLLRTRGFNQSQVPRYN